MMPNKSIYRDADAAEINLYELNFARFFSIQTSENGWRRVVCELVRRAAKGTKELRLEDGTELPGEKTFPDYVVDLMDSYLAVLPDAKPHAYPAAEREQLMERHCRHTEDGGIDYDYYQDMTLYTFIFNMRNVGAGALYAKRGPFWHGGHMYSDGTLNTYLTGGCRAVSIEDCSPSAFNSALNSYMALRNYTAHSSADAEDLDTEDLLNLACLACWLTAHLYCSAQDEALAHMRHVRDEIAEELGRTIEPHDEYDLAFHQAKPWLEDHKSTPGTAAAKGGRSHASRHHSYGEGLPFPFEGGDITAPFLVGPWERPLNAQAIFPSQIGAAFPREYEHLCPEMPGAELEQGLLHGATRAYPPKELPEMDYASRQPFLKDIQFTKENGGKTKKALDLLSKGLYYATMASSFVVLLMWGGFCGLFGAKSAPFFVLVNMHDGQRDAIAHMFIDRCAHDLKTHRYKPLLAPGIALTLIYLYLEYLSLDPYFWLTRVFRFVYNPLSWICFFLFAGLLVLDAVHAANTYKQYRHLENTIGAAVYFYLFKMARVPGKIGFAVGLMLIMDIFGNYPYLFPIMVTGWLAMQACSKMVTGSADLKY